MKRAGSKRGFTVVELIAVVAIIALVTAVGVPAAGSMINYGKIAADQQAMATIEAAVKSTYATTSVGYVYLPDQDVGGRLVLYGPGATGGPLKMETITVKQCLEYNGVYDGSLPVPTQRGGAETFFWNKATGELSPFDQGAGWTALTDDVQLSELVP